jgi:hypothetical protein
MADQKKEPDFEGMKELPLKPDERPEVFLSPESADNLDKLEGKVTSEEEKAKKILEKLHEGAEEIIAAEMEEKEINIEERKEKVTTAWVMKALAAGDDYTKAEQIISEARKRYIVKYPGVVDAIHDRWMDQRNKGLY